MKKMILSWIFYFFFAIAFYQVFATFSVYGLELFSSQFPAYLREGIWWIAILIILILHFKQLKEYFKTRKWTWISFLGLSLFSVLISYFFLEKNVSDIIIGFKYCFQWMVIFLSFTMIGFFYREKFSSQGFLHRLKIFLIFIVIFWFFWQILKLVSPDFFSWIGYELNLDNYKPEMKPPLYYLTGYEGTLRWQGLFSGPNNYGYFLVAFLPIVALLFGEKLKNIKQFTLQQRINVGIVILWIGAMVLTLSRAVFVGGILVAFILHWDFFKKRKKMLIALIGIGLVALVGVSLRKRDSTREHLINKFSAISDFINQPLGYGLGTSGPSIHYNGIFLPENYYFQILLDTGTIGFLLQIFCLFQILWISHLLLKKFQKEKMTDDELMNHLLVRKFQLGFFALMIIGFFLHVFEDSMVNYLFFGMYGLLLGRISKTLWKVPCFNPFSRKNLNALRK